MCCWTAASPCTRSTPNSSIGCAIASAWLGPKDDRRDARVAAAGLRTDPHLFRPLQIGEPSVVELREWSRLAEELQQERLRLTNRIRQQLWRYYPQLLTLSDDLSAEWILELWSMAPTPAKAARLGEAALAHLLHRHRIRRLDATAQAAGLDEMAVAGADRVTIDPLALMRLPRRRSMVSSRPSSTGPACTNSRIPSFFC
jgi:hypothetical protein